MQTNIKVTVSKTGGRVNYGRLRPYANDDGIDKDRITHW